MNNAHKIIIAFSLTLSFSCGKADSNENFDMNASDVACKNVSGYTIDFQVPCKKFNKPDKDFGCLPCSNESCTGLQAQGCYLTPDKSVVIFTKTISEPDPFLKMGWSYCSEKTIDNENIYLDDLPTCE